MSSSKTMTPRIRESYGPKYDRLRMIKRKYDPDNVFRRNANIKPADLADSPQWAHREVSEWAGHNSVD
jgi:hypothetical protein